jgi:hypothetical protein
MSRYFAVYLDLAVEERLFMGTSTELAEAYEIYGMLDAAI